MRQRRRAGRRSIDAMREIASAELHVLARELNERISGSYIKKFYDMGGGRFKLVLHKEDKLVLYIDMLRTANLTGVSEQAGQATAFAMAVRKRMENSKITGVEQHGSDRILIMHISGAKDYTMIIEMFAKGNLIITDKDYRIELCYRIADLRDRQVRPKALYVFPKSDSISIYPLDSKALDRVLEEAAASSAGAVSFLSKRINIGPVYLEEIIRGCGLDPRERLGREWIGKLSSAITSFLGGLGKPQFSAYIDENGIVDYSVVPLGRHAGKKMVEYGSLNELLDGLYMGQRLDTRDEEKERKVKEIEISIGKQKESAASLKEKAVEYGNAANRIFENMNEINALISYMRENRRAGAAELSGEFRGFRILGIDLKNKTVRIDIG